MRYDKPHKLNVMSITIHGLDQTICYCEAKGLAACLTAYAEEVGTEEIMEMGFNPNSGYTYIALENGISICSSMGGDVEYLITNMETGEETFLDSYQDAESCMAVIQDHDEE